MANEIQLPTQTGLTLYAIVRNGQGQPFNTSTGAFEAWADANITRYAVALSEEGHSGFYVGNFPTAVTAMGSYTMVVYIQAGGSPAVGDTAKGEGSIVWSGSQEVVQGTNDLISLADYRNVVDSSSSDSKLTFLISAASQAISNFCEWEFTSQTMTEYLDGQGFGWVQLSALPQTLTSVTVDWESSQPQVIPITEVNWSSTGVLYFKPSSTYGPCFPPGYRNVEVVYTTSGVVPDGLKEICCEVVMALEYTTDSQQFVSDQQAGQIRTQYNTGLINLDDPAFAHVRTRLQWFAKPLCI